MSVFAKPTTAPPARTDASRQISLLYAGILVLFLVAQLFTFDEFIQLIPSFNLPVGGLLYAVAPLIVVGELFALPFLLRMSTSTALRWVSMVCGWMVAVIWIGISWWVVAMQPGASTVGFLGTVGDLSPGWWAILVAVAMGILAAWASWGLWPGTHATSTKK
ncbi:MAG: hypothetical protein ACREGE_04380 [Candidatus Microsaccharimonas sp.]